MNEKLNTRTDERLLDARREGLKNFHETSMRSHGKLWGMDVFSWINPKNELIANTLNSFPFPVLWVGNSSNIRKALEEEELIMSNLHSVVVYDSNVFNFHEDWLDGIKNCAGTNSVEDAFSFLKLFKAPQKVLLFTTSRENSEENMQSFENYLNANRV